MIIYMIVKNIEVGNAIARALFSLTVPVHLQDERQQRMRNGTTLKHPEREEYRLPVYDTSYPCHAEADEHCLDEYVQPFIDEGLIDAQVLIDMQQAIIAAKGGQIDTLGNLPSFWIDSGLDEQQMYADGWFPQLEE